MSQRYHKKAQRRFDALFSDGMSLLHARDYQAGGEKLLQAVHEAPLVWTKHRFFAFSFLLSSKFDGDMRGIADMTQDQIDAIAVDFLENENEPAHFRALAAFWLGAHYTEAGTHMNENTAAEFLRQGLDSIAASSSTKEDENRQVLYPPYQRFGLDKDHMFPPSDLSLKAVLSYMEQKIRKRLTAITTIEEEANPNQVHNITLTRLRQRTRAGGLMCDCCGKSLEELHMTSLMRCKRCATVFYCSLECQREDWKHKGHKQTCREKGQIEIGDDMKLNDETKPYFEFVKVISSLGGDQWQVQYYGSGEFVAVNGVNLIRIRPPACTLLSA